MEMPSWELGIHTKRATDRDMVQRPNEQRDFNLKEEPEMLNCFNVANYTGREMMVVKKCDKAIINDGGQT